MARPCRDWTGTVCGCLTVRRVARDHPNPSMRLWLVRCRCGRTFSRTNRFLRRNVRNPPSRCGSACGKAAGGKPPMPEPVVEVMGTPAIRFYRTGRLG